MELLNKPNPETYFAVDKRRRKKYRILGKWFSETEVKNQYKELRSLPNGPITRKDLQVATGFYLIISEENRKRVQAQLAH